MSPASSPPRLIVLVEGETEIGFVQRVLSDHLLAAGYAIVSPTKYGNSRRKAHRVGNRGWQEVRRDVLRHLKEDRGRYVTLLVDYYGMPMSAQKEWPGRRDAGSKPWNERAKVIQDALNDDIRRESGELYRRFVPNVLIHEFEALLFSDPRCLAATLARPSLEAEFADVRSRYPSPEAIDDGPETHPSKRIERLFPEFSKTVDGLRAAAAIGLDRMRQECPSFGSWLSRLESIVRTSGD